MTNESFWWSKASTAKVLRYLGHIYEWYRDPFRAKPTWSEKTVLLLTVVVAFIYLGQLKEMSRSTRAAQDAARAAENSAAHSKQSLDAAIEQNRLDQRAWIGIEDVKAPDAISAGPPIVFAVNIKNSGKTPALNLKMFTIIGRAYPPDELNDLDFQAADTGSNYAHAPGTMMPGTFAHVLVQTEHPMTETRVADIRSGKEVIYIWGTIRYEDIFQHQHATKFCVVGSERLINTEKGTFTLDFSECTRHNDAD